MEGGGGVANNAVCYTEKTGFEKNGNRRVNFLFSAFEITNCVFTVINT